MPETIPPPLTTEEIHSEHDAYLESLCNKLSNGECNSYVCCLRGVRMEGRSIDEAAEVETTCPVFEIHQRLHNRPEHE